MPASGIEIGEVCGLFDELFAAMTPVPLQGRDFTTNGEFTVGAGDTVPFVLTAAHAAKGSQKRSTPIMAATNPAGNGTTDTRWAFIRGIPVMGKR
jgi:hypothetical protein